MAGSRQPEAMADLSTYAQAFEQAQFPAASREARRAELARFLAQGFPSRRHEWWRYTDLSALAAQTLKPASGRMAAAARLPRTDGLVYVDGRLLDTASSATELSAPVEFVTDSGVDGDEGLQALNRAFATPGLNLQLGERASIARPFHLVLAGSADGTMTHQRHCVRLGAQAQATLIVDFRGEAGNRLATHTLDIELAEGAQLKLYRVQTEGAGSSLLVRTDARLAAHAQLQAVCIDGGAGLCRQDFNVELQGPGADIALHGLFMPRVGAHLDNHTRIVHAQPHGRSREYFRGIVDARTQAIFNGKIVVAPGAQKTDSEQRLATLLLSRKAEVNAKPELEIHADDVRCAHGASVGQLDTTALSYLRLRGLDAETARKLLLRGFAAQILDTIALPSLRADVQQRLGLDADDDAALIDALGAFEEEPA